LQTTSPASNSDNPPPQGNRGKVGLAWANGDNPDIANFVTDAVGYVYTWSPQKPGNVEKLGLQFCPMLWGDRQIQQFQELVVKGYANCVFGMNEPNEKGQSNMPPSHGAYLWKTYIQPLKDQGYRLIAPATSSNPNGMTWMKEFMKECDGCTFDGMAIHNYSPLAKEFIAYCNLWYNTFGLPLWATEFACQNFDGGPQCTQSGIFSYMSTITSWMQNTPWIEAYFAFGVMTNLQGVNQEDALMNGEGKPTDLGYLYLHP